VCEIQTEIKEDMVKMAVIQPKTKSSFNSWLRNFYVRNLQLHRLNSLGWSLIRGVIILGICYLILYPTIIKISVAFMSYQDMYDMTVKYIPRNFTLKNFRDVSYWMNYPVALFNTFKLSLLTSTLQIISCTIIGYGFARFQFKGRNLLFAAVILTLVVPPQTIMVSLFMHFRFFDFFGLFTMGSESSGINLLDSYWPFILLSSTGMGLKNGLYIYILRQFFRGMPKELEEAAYVDGAGLFRTFLTVMLPSAVPAMATVYLFSFVWQWTDNFYTGLFLNRLSVLSVQLSGVSLTARTDLRTEGSLGVIDPAYASMLNNTGSLLVVVPLIVLYLFAQRYFVESVERSGLVG
jgi:multiple sugar transport system permease protein